MENGNFIEWGRQTSSVCERTTLVLPKPGFEIGALSSSNFVVLWFGAGPTKLSFSSQNVTLSKSKAAAPGG